MQGHLKDIFESEKNNQACVTSSSPGNQVDGLPGGFIAIFDMKNKVLGETCQANALRISILHLV